MNELLEKRLREIREARADRQNALDAWQQAQEAAKQAKEAFTAADNYFLDITGENTAPLFPPEAAE